MQITTAKRKHKVEFILVKNRSFCPNEKGMKTNIAWDTKTYPQIWDDAKYDTLILMLCNTRQTNSN